MSNIYELAGPHLLVTAAACFLLAILVVAYTAIRFHHRWHSMTSSHAYLHAIVKAADTAFISTDAHGLILDCNGFAERLFGYRKEEMLGRSIAMLMPSLPSELHPTFLLRHIKHISKSMGNRRREILGRHKDGKLIPLQLSLSRSITPAGLIFVGYLQDLSERKRADAQLRVSANVFRHIHEGVAIIDVNYTITDVNPSFERLMEMSKHECIGQSLVAMYENVDIPPDMSGLWRCLATEHHWQADVMLTHSSGQVWMQRLSISPVLNEFQRPHYFIAVISNMSERLSNDCRDSQAELHDASTGLPTRKLFMDGLTFQLISSQRKRTNTGVMCVRFIMHACASTHDLEQAQRLIAQLLQPQLRCTDTLARYDKDLLTILLPGIKDASSFHTLLERLTQSTHERHHHCSIPHLQRLHIGYASTLDGYFSSRDLIDAAISSHHSQFLHISKHDVLSMHTPH